MIRNNIISYILLIIVSLSSTYSYPKCRMPTGYTGECRYLDKCKPLLDINDKMAKSEEELLYLRESSCGTTSNYRYKVCCPLQSEWSKKLDFKPILFPEIQDYLSKPEQNRSKSGSRPVKVDGQITTAVRSQGFGGDFKSVDDRDHEECGIQVSTFSQNRDDGDVATDQYPWLALLEYRGGAVLCGGSLISLQFVLTAAHCVETNHGPPTMVRLSEYNTTSYPNDYVSMEGGGFDTVVVTLIPIEWTAKHPLFTLTTYQHDIGLLKLSEQAQYSDFIRPICLPRYNYANEFKTGTNFMTAGWGSNGDVIGEVKKESHLPYVPMESCKRSIADSTLSNKQICAGGRDRAISCTADSGGPLMFECDSYYTVVGVASYGPRNCSKVRKPTVYTNVHEYLEWIDSKME